MLHFASFTPSPASPRPSVPPRYDSLNATQTAANAGKVPPLFLAIEEELHDSRRIHAHGQEEDLKYALGKALDRISELSKLLQESYKSHAELETQLGLAKSNLQLVIANNEMLEDALKRDSSIRDVGWNRGNRNSKSGNASSTPSRTASIDQQHGDGACSSPVAGSPASSSAASPVVSAASPPPSQQQQDSKFFKFRFSSNTGSRPASASGSPVTTASPLFSGTSSSSAAHHKSQSQSSSHGQQHLTSPSLPILPVVQSERDVERDKEFEELNAKLEAERKKYKDACDAKDELEAELESLSAALFEEANKMVATERIKLHETMEELKEARQEKEALKSALRIVEGENSHLRTSSVTNTPAIPSSAFASTSTPGTKSRSSSVDGIKSRPVSGQIAVDLDYELEGGDDEALDDKAEEADRRNSVRVPPRRDSRNAFAEFSPDSSAAAIRADLAASAASSSTSVEEMYSTPSESPAPAGGGANTTSSPEVADTLSSSKEEASTPPSKAPTTSSSSSMTSPPPTNSAHSDSTPQEPDTHSSLTPQSQDSDKTPGARSPLVLPPDEASPWADS